MSEDYYLPTPTPMQEFKEVIKDDIPLSKFMERVSNNSICKYHYDECGYLQHMIITMKNEVTYRKILRSTN